MRLRVLGLDHYFDQDLKSLEGHPQLDVRRIPFQRLRRPALRILGDDVGTGLEAFARPALEPARRRYARWLAGEVRRIYLERSFDVIVLPSDTFFYVRDLPAAARALGIPIVVVQKETTISPDTMAGHSTVVARYAPFAADLMTVCSERQRQFWVACGAGPEAVVVTGQPRFDVYARPTAKTRRTEPVVLFFSYELDAYVPGVAGGMGLRTWERLRDATERTLLDAAGRGVCQVVVKPHPQQLREGEAERLRSLAGPLWGTTVVLADPEADTRELIRSSDIVAGFQTTALYEAAAAGKPLIYAAWGEEYESRLEHLIPFHRAPPGTLSHASSPERLAGFLASGVEEPRPTCRAWFEEAIGPVDGHACDRVAAVLAAVAAKHPAGASRQALDGGRRRYAARVLPRAAASELAWAALAMPARLAGRRAGAADRRKRASERRRMATEALATRPGAAGRRRSSAF